MTPSRRFGQDLCAEPRAGARVAALLLLTGALIAPGCGGHLPSGSMPPGVRERVVSVVPIDVVPVMPQQVPRWGRVRAGVVGGLAPTDRARAPEPDAGQRHTPAMSGELFVGLSMPGTGYLGDGTAGWELVGGATADVAPGSRGHDLEPTLVAPERNLLGGYLRINGLIGVEWFTLGASLTVRAAEIPFAWDYGDCVGGPNECKAWDPKGAPATGRDLAWGFGGAVMWWNRVGARGGYMLGYGFDGPPSITTDRRDAILCDGNGNCTGGRKPSAPDATMGGEHRQVILGADFQPAPWSRAFILLVWTTVVTSGWEDNETFKHVRAGFEASF